MIQNIIEQFNLNCTDEEFLNYYNSIDLSEIEAELNAVQPTILTFDEKYNGVDIENPANGEVYYTVEIGDRVFLQNIVPFVGGLYPITEENVNEVFDGHKNVIIDEYLQTQRLQITIEHFTPTNA